MCAIAILETQDCDSSIAVLSNYDLDCFARTCSLPVSFADLFESCRCSIGCHAPWAALMLAPHQAGVLVTSSEGGLVEHCRLLQWPEAITPELRDARPFAQVLAYFDRQRPVRVRITVTP